MAKSDKFTAGLILLVVLLLSTKNYILIFKVSNNPFENVLLFLSWFIISFLMSFEIHSDWERALKKYNKFIRRKSIIILICSESKRFVFTLYNLEADNQLLKGKWKSKQNLAIHLYIYLSIFYSSIHLLFIYLSISLTIQLYIQLYIQLSIQLSIHLSSYPTIYLTISTTIYSFI